MGSILEYRIRNKKSSHDLGKVPKEETQRIPESII